MKKSVLIELNNRFEAIKTRMKRLEEKIEEIKRAEKFEDEVEN